MNKTKKIDWLIFLVPLILIISVSLLIFTFPKASNSVIGQLRFWVGDTFGVFFLAIGLFFFLLSIFLAFSKYGNIVY